MTQYEIEKIASSLLLSSFEQIQIPIDLYKILSYLDIKLVKDDLKGESGYILHKDGKYRIILSNSSEYSITHLRFTLAHEIAHIVIRHLTDFRHIPHWHTESEANRLASALLMPFHFTVAYRDYPLSVLASFMAVSHEAMVIRKKEVRKDPLYNLSVKLYKPNLIRDYNAKLEVII